MFKAGMFITRMITVISQIRNVLKLICQLFTKGVVSHRKRLKCFYFVYCIEQPIKWKLLFDANFFYK